MNDLPMVGYIVAVAALLFFAILSGVNSSMETVSNLLQPLM